MISDSDDPLDHPDLARLARRMREELERVLAAEQSAAEAMLRHNSTLRDRLLDIEFQGGTVTVQWASGRSRSGRVISVGLDYLEIEDGAMPVLVPFELTEWIEL